jgi:hypothetical protein
MSLTCEQIHLCEVLPSRVQPYNYGENWAAININQDEYNALRVVSAIDQNNGITPQIRINFITGQLAWRIQQETAGYGPIYTKLSLLVCGQQVETVSMNG